MTNRSRLSLLAVPLSLSQRLLDTALSEAQQHVWLDPLLRSINAIAAGLRNTR